VDPSSGAVRVSLTARGEKLSIAFEDNGPGIPADVRQRAFEPYFTTKARGTGLGLAICRNIVAEHGGTIEIDSPDRGARIVVTLQRPTAAGPVTTSQRDVKEPDAY
jgi:signal transduction histidine kinase